MKKMLARNRFTLVELLVAMGIFSILLVLFMQFFSGMRLAWTNTEKRTSLHGDVRIAMDMLSALIGTAYYSSASTFSGEEGHFPFLADQSAARPGKLYFACKAPASLDLPGTNPIRFIGVQVPNRDETFGLTDTDLLYKLYVTVLSNDASANNGDVYPRFSPEFLNDSNEEIAPSAALTALKTNLNGKLAAESSHRIELLSYVTDFRVLAYDEKGRQYSVVSGTAQDCFCVPYVIELRISVLSEEDFRKWVSLKDGSVVTGEEKASGGENPARKFRLERQITFSRRIYIGSCHDKGEE